MIGADGQERDIGMKALANLGKAVKVGRVTGMVDGIFAMGDDITAKSTMHVANDAGTPMLRGRVGDRQSAMSVFFPPFQLDDLAEAEVRNEVANVARDDQDGSLSESAAMTRDGTERRAVEVIEMRVRDQHDVDARQISNTKAGTTQTF